MSSKKVTKSDLVDKIYQNCKCEKKVVQSVVDEFLIALKVSLKETNTIELRGFGTLEPRLRKGRNKARNPKTGENLSVAPHYTVVFRAGQDLKNSLMELPVSESEK